MKFGVDEFPELGRGVREGLHCAGLEMGDFFCVNECVREQD